MRLTIHCFVSHSTNMYFFRTITLSPHCAISQSDILKPLCLLDLLKAYRDGRRLAHVKNLRAASLNKLDCSVVRCCITIVPVDWSDERLSCEGVNIKKKARYVNVYVSARAGVRLCVCTVLSFRFKLFLQVNECLPYAKECLYMQSRNRVGWESCREYDEVSRDSATLAFSFVYLRTQNEQNLYMHAKWTKFVYRYIQD